MSKLDRRKTIFWVLLVTGLGAALRMAAFGSVPGGLYQDEAFNGLDALSVLEGEFPLYFTANNGREPLFIYLASLSIAGLGRTPAAVRLPAALLGTLTIPISAALAAGLFNRRVALISATLVALSFWPLHLSRIAFRAVGLPFFLGLALAAGWWGVKRHHRGLLLLGGVAYGLAFYTYLPIYFTPLVLALFALYLWQMGHRQALRLVLPWFSLGAAISLVPLAITFVGNPSLIWGRAGQVSVLSNGEPLMLTLFRQIGRGLGMYVWRGDTILRHNLPGRPVFDLLVLPFFVWGLVWLVRQWRRPAAMLVLLWSILMLAPTILAEDAPHFLRAVGVLPVAFLCPALGLDRFHRWLTTRVGRKWVSTALPALVLFGSGGFTVRDYFVRYAQHPQSGYAFQAAAVTLANQINQVDGPVWASVRFPDVWESVTYLVARDVHWIPEGEVAHDLSLPAALFIWPYEPVAPQLAALPPNVRIETWLGPEVKGDLEIEPYPLYWAYRLEPAPGQTDEPLARFENGIRLQQASLESVEMGLALELEWSTEQFLPADYQVFVHVMSHEVKLAQDDGPLAGGRLPTSWWRPQDVLVDHREISLTVPYQPREHQIVVGLYDNYNGERLTVLDAAGQFTKDSVILDQFP